MTQDHQTGLSRRIWQQTWPMTLGVLSLLGFNLVDSVFVARLGTEPLAAQSFTCLLYTSPSPRDATLSRMPSSA